MTSLDPQDQLDQLLAQVYDDLRELASRALRHERAGHTLQTTALVHEAYLRLSGLQRIHWDDPRHVLRTAVAVMRRVLVDCARQKKALKRDLSQLLLSGVPEQLAGETDAPGFDILALHDALERLRELDPRKAEIVELRYFGGQTLAEVAQAMDLSPATVKRQWAFTKAWLFRELGDQSS